MDILAGENDFVAQSLEQWLKKRSRPPFASLHMALQRRYLQLQLHALHLQADFELIEQLRLAPGQAITVNPCLSVVRESDGLVGTRKILGANFNFDQKNVDLLKTCSIVLFSGRAITWEYLTVNRCSIPKAKAGESREVFDAQRIGSKIILRHWAPGDRFQPIGMPVSVKLQDLFVNMKVPRNERHKRIVATTADGEIFWVEGLRIAEWFKVLKDSTRLLLWRWRKS